MKNSLSRLLVSANRSKRAFKSTTGPVFSDQIREEIKSKLLELIQKPDNIILGQNAYEQLTLATCVFVKYDFPSNWPALNQWLLSTFDSLY